VGALGLELHAKVAAESLDSTAGDTGRGAKPPVKAATTAGAGARRGARGAAQASSAAGAQPRTRRQRVNSR
jgi:hypothetical protein